MSFPFKVDSMPIDPDSRMARALAEMYKRALRDWDEAANNQNEPARIAARKSAVDANRANLETAGIDIPDTSEALR